MFQYASPESCGLSSRRIKEYIAHLERNQLRTHDVIIAKGHSIVYENYWAPFHKDFQHRMYSVTKSYVALAVGFLEQDGLISLDDPIGKYFPEEMKLQSDENFRRQTIRHMLMMSTAKQPRYEFTYRPDDLVRFYFENDRTESRPSGTIYRYDSTGSVVLGALAERLTGKTLMEYLREKFLDAIGFSAEATCLRIPGGHSWGDSALICTAQDLLKTGRFLLDGGRCQGKQLLNEEYIRQATSKQIDNNMNGFTSFNSMGYGYQIWRTRRNSFFFNGMGCQIAVCVPDTDMILVYNGDNQGHDAAKSLIIDGFFDLVEAYAEDAPLPADEPAAAELAAYSASLKLMTAKGEVETAFQKQINGVPFTVAPNPMGITRMCLTFSDGGGTFAYTNEQGDKTIEFGMCENRFGLFPQEGYPNEVSMVQTKGFYYKCAASAAWVEPRKLQIRVQIIDKYFGNLMITIGFREDGLAGIYMMKAAEDFLNEYQGYATAIPEPVK